MFFSESAADSSSRQVGRKEEEDDDGEEKEEEEEVEFEKKQNGGGEERGIAKKLVAMAQVCEKEKKETGNRGSKEKPSGVEDKIVGIKKTQTDTKKTTCEGKKRPEGYLVSAEDAPVYNLEVFVTHFIFLVLKYFILSSIQYKRFMGKKYEENCTSSQISHKTNATFFMVFIHQFWMSQSKT